MIDLKGQSKEELERFFAEQGEKSFRASQLVKWMYLKRISDFEAMTDFGRKLRRKLEEQAFIGELNLVRRQVCGRGDTEKFLFSLSDGNLVESVLMSYEDHLGPSRLTACISTQVGCAMGCGFCATSQGGLVRNLTAGEIVDQIVQMQKNIDGSQRRIANIVYMGMGEPFLNYENVMKSLGILNDPEGIAVGMRHMALSTCGVVPGIVRLAGEGIQVKLAVSLHSPFDSVRSRLMPINGKYPISALLESLRFYQRETGRRVTFEYALIRGVNDRPCDSERLAELLEGLTSFINMIPLNPVAGSGMERSPEKNIRRFQEYLVSRGIRATVRKERGVDIDAACGQLRKRHGEREREEKLQREAPASAGTEEDGLF